MKKLSLVQIFQSLLKEGVYSLQNPEQMIQQYGSKEIISNVYEWLNRHPSFKEDLDKISHWAGVSVRDGIGPFLDWKARTEPKYFEKIEYNQFLNDLIKNEIENIDGYQAGPGQPFKTLHKGKDKAPWRS